MAKMGQRKVSEKKGGGELTLPALGLGVLIPTIQVEAAGTVAGGSTLGTPIMREGFVTETGFLPSSMVFPSPMRPLRDIEQI